MKCRGESFRRDWEVYQGSFQSAYCTIE
jgi:hypothetical protein